MPNEKTEPLIRGLLGTFESFGAAPLRTVFETPKTIVSNRTNGSIERNPTFGQVAIGYQAIKAGFLVLYRSIFDVVRHFLHDEALAGQDKVLAKYLKPDLLIIDNMGTEQLPKRSREYLFDIIMRWYETHSTVRTSNRSLEDWGKLIGDVAAATAILDRFLHHPEVITITGRSYRLKNRQTTKD